jgi:hypothetical protein
MSAAPEPRRTIARPATDLLTGYVDLWVQQATKTGDPQVTDR